MKEFWLGLRGLRLRKGWFEGDIGNLWVQISESKFKSPLDLFSCSGEGHNMKFLHVNLIRKFFSPGFAALDPRASSMRSRSPLNSFSWLRVGVNILPFHGIVRVFGFSSFMFSKSCWPYSLDPGISLSVVCQLTSFTCLVTLSGEKCKIPLGSLLLIL